MERCPFCGGQLTCNCAYKRFYRKQFRPQRWVWNDRTKITGGRFVGHPTDGLPKEVYEHGLPEGIANKWEEVLDKKGRIPYIVYPNLCCRCGTKFPEMFSVPDEVWEKYVAPAERCRILCKPCFERIKKLIDKGC
jgi:hypothetical protein